MNAPAILAAVLREALPEAVPLDLTLPAGWMMPHWPGIRGGLAAAAQVPVAEYRLLASFRQRGGTRRAQAEPGLPLYGVDPAIDSGFEVGAPATWGGAGSGRVAMPLLILQAASDAPRALLEAGAMVLLRSRGEAAKPLPGPERGRIMLLAGSLARVERHDLLLPAGRVPAIFEALRAAAGRFAAATGGGWKIGGRVVDPHLASLGVLSESADVPRAPILLGPARMPHDLPPDVAPARAARAGREDEAATRNEALALGPARTIRLLVGALPPLPFTLRVRLRGAEAARPPALFMDGCLVATRHRLGETGESILEGRVTPVVDRAIVLGLAQPAGTGAGVGGGLFLLGVEFAA